MGREERDSSTREGARTRDARASTAANAQSKGQEIAQRLTAAALRLLDQPLAPGLYLVATPIGNLADVTVRALSTLARASIVYCEDTRHSRTLLDAYAITATLRPYHEHNAEAERPRILRELGLGKSVALISDAGTPLISDPGFKLVRDAAAEGYAVVSIPGPSAALAALTVSGLPTDAFFFAGFLPAREGARRNRIEELKGVPGTLVFFEAPTRVADTLADLGHVLGSRNGAVARELTKLHEEVRRGTLAELAATYANEEPKGEVVILVAPPSAAAVSDADIEARLADLLGEMSVRDAAKTVAEALGAAKARVYEIALKLKDRAS